MNQPVISQDKPSAANTRQPKNLRRWLMPLVLALVAVAVVVFFQFRVEQLIIEQAALKQHLSILNQQSTGQTQQSTRQQVQMENTQQALTSMQGQLAFMQQTLNQIPGARLDDWKLAEVEYLLRLANQRVYLQQELAGASALLDAANQILAALDDPSLLVVREKIAQEMLAIGQANQLDRQGIYSQIQALKAVIHDAVLPPTEFTQTSKNEIVVSSEENAIAPTLWQRIGNQLSQFISVRYRDDAFEAPLKTEQYQLLEHSLMLMLEQAQWALLKGEQTLFNASLGNAANWIENKLRHQQALQLLAQITQLQSINIAPITPDVSQSLRLLRQILQDRTYRPSETAEPEQTNAPEQKSEQKKSQPAAESTKAINTQESA